MVKAASDPRERRVRDALAEIPDPEIPNISVVDLGVIGDVRFSDDGRRLTVEMLPTFVGCPAIDVMRQQIGDRLRELNVAEEVHVEVSFAEPWTSDRISAAGRDRLRESGFAPPAAVPPAREGLDGLSVLPIAECPYCRSRNTTLENPFGPTLCRAIYHCADCLQPFEQFKRV